MATNECGCTNNDCPHKTSEIIFDGQLTNINIPAGSTLNEVFSLIESFILTSNQCSDVNFTLSAYSACLGLAAGTYSFNQIITALIARVCANTSAIQSLESGASSMPDLNTDNVLLENIIFPSCYTSFTGNTVTNLFSQILNDLCGLLSDVAPVVDDTIYVTPPDPGTQVDPGGNSAMSRTRYSRLEHVAEAIKSIVDNTSYLYEYSAPSVSPTSFTVGILPMRGIIDGYLVIRKISEDLTVNPSVDTYFFLSGDGTVLRREVASGAPAPATPSLSMPLYKVESDGSGVSTYSNLYETEPLLPVALGVGDVDTPNIKDGSITSIKLADVVTSKTLGDASLFSITFNTKGQITGYSGNLNISGPTNGQILKFNSGLNRFENSDNTTISSSNSIPKSNASATDYEDSSLSETTNQVKSIKKVEINSGVTEDDANAILNLVATDKYLMIPRMTAVQAGALPLNDGALVYVNTTDATFTSVGFWGVVAGAWTKL